MLGVLMIAAVVKLVDFEIRKGIGKIWKAMAVDIAPGCPGCTPPENIK
jgi:hypothetical protein